MKIFLFALLLPVSLLGQKKITGDKEQLQITKQRAAALRWNDLSQSTYREHYRMEIEREGIFVEWGTDANGKNVGIILLRFQDKTKRFASRQITMNEADADTLVNYWSKEMGMQLVKWIAPNPDAYSVIRGELYYAGIYEFATPTTYTLLIAPCACKEKTRGEDQLIIDNLKNFSGILQDIIRAGYKSAIDAAKEEMKQQGYNFLEYWVKGL